MTVKQIAEEAERMLEDAAGDILKYPDRAAVRIAYAQRQLAHIQRLMTEAKVGK